MKIKNLFLTASLLVCFESVINAQNVPSYVPTTGLVGWWPFTGNAADSSGNGNNATVNGASLTNDRNGNVANAYNFNGTSSYLALPNGLSTAFGSGKITVAAWVFFSVNSTWASVVKNWGSTTTGAYHLGLSDNSQKLQVQITQANSTTVTVTAPSTISMNTWHHVAFTADGSLIHLYQDGVEIATAVSYDGTLKTSFLYTNIGAKAGTTNTPASFPGYLNGKTDDIGIWSSALTLQQISNLYNVGLPTSIQNTTRTNSLKIYPNPASEAITIQTINKANNSWVKVVDLLGNEIMREALSSDRHTLSISGLPQGIYFIEVSDNKEILREKVIKY